MADDRSDANGAGNRTGDPDGDDHEGSPPSRPPPGTEPTPRNALVWGVVAVLAFGVFHQAYLLLGGRFLGFGPVLVVALVVGVVAAASSYLVGGRLAENGHS